MKTMKFSPGWHSYNSSITGIIEFIKEQVQLFLGSALKFQMIGNMPTSNMNTDL